MERKEKIERLQTSQTNRKPIIITIKRIKLYASVNPYPSIDDSSEYVSITTGTAAGIEADLGAEIQRIKIDEIESIEA